MKLLTLIGSTGSIGRQTLQVVRHYPDKFKVKGLIAHSDWENLIKQANEFRPEFIALTNKEASEKLVSSGYSGKILPYDTALEDCVTPDLDVVLVACSGINGLIPTLKAISYNVDVALANKETLVVGGELVKSALKGSSSNLYPVDSEHSAIWQSINGNDRKDIKRIIITASGGAFRDLKKEELYAVKAKDALKHPNWNMGKKITIDCATLMNKGLEIIEASFLFDVEVGKVVPIIHPESIIHSMVEYNDGAVMAQMGTPSMVLPIQYALTYPERLETGVSQVDFLKVRKLNFYEPDRDRFPCLRIAEEVGRVGGLLRTAMNAANDVAVDLFLKDKIGFMEIPELVLGEVNKFQNKKDFNLFDVLTCDREIKEKIYSKYGV
ncbi:MAG: 1-deoxy-D-xylulose-5-phosphate reductoisomerase [Clostridia bacterium]|nr:1-deoxy-D-xylulose-5-phosphate reductoisomerase [Clostridia bacterium]